MAAHQRHVDVDRRELPLREERKRAGLSQEALALESDVDRKFVAQFERGIRQPSLPTLFKLAGPLQCAASTLIARVERHAK
jgi:transcriptional regulator with XRE-family HTH domain